MTHDISGVIVLLQTRIEKDPGEKKKLLLPNNIRIQNEEERDF